MCEVRKRMTSQEFADLISINCAVVGTLPTDDERKIYRELYIQDLKDGVSTTNIDIGNKGFLQKVSEFFAFGNRGD